MRLSYLGINVGQMETLQLVAERNELLAKAVSKRNTLRP